VATWRIEITRTATRQITKLDQQGQKAIVKFLRERLTSADYRLICDIQDEKVTVLILELGHRKDVYR